MEQQDKSENPLLKALPPETDYLSYLTILEYNLSKSQLEVLHGILQDVTLTANIGWDLVHLLVPHLPESQDCLTDVARLGNPREVILKVTELLTRIGGESTGEDDDGPGEIDQIGKSQSQDESRPPVEERFVALVGMLTILHPRIKTKYPSRFLCTSLRALLSAFSACQDIDLAILQALARFLRSVIPKFRPPLPPRELESDSESQHAVPSRNTSSLDTEKIAPDPEASQDSVATGEAELQKRLLQSFVTYLIELHVASLSGADTGGDYDAVGLSWAARYHEYQHPEKIFPGRLSKSNLFNTIRAFQERDQYMQTWMTIAKDLAITPDEATQGLLPAPPDQDTDHDDEGKSAAEDSEYPSSPSDVSLSRDGCLYLICLMSFFDLTSSSSNGIIQSLNNAPPRPMPLTLNEYVECFSSYASLSHGDEMSPSQSIPPSVLDALVFIGLLVQENTSSVHASKSSKEVAEESLLLLVRSLSRYSATTSSPSLRYQTHLLTTALLHHNLSPTARLDFIRSTLEETVYENLKVTAVGWLRDEMATVLSSTESVPFDTANDGTEGKALSSQPSAESVFTSATVLPDLAPQLFNIPSPSGPKSAALSPDVHQHAAFVIAVLNLLHFILANKANVHRSHLDNTKHIDLIRKFLVDIEVWKQDLWELAGRASEDMSSELGLVEMNRAEITRLLGEL